MPRPCTLLHVNCTVPLVKEHERHKDNELFLSATDLVKQFKLK
jgi:hypothetical protein